MCVFALLLYFAHESALAQSHLAHLLACTQMYRRISRGASSVYPSHSAPPDTQATFETPSLVPQGPYGADDVTKQRLAEHFRQLARATREHASRPAFGQQLAFEEVVWPEVAARIHFGCEV